MTARERFADAERSLFAKYGLECESRRMSRSPWNFVPAIL
jgi:hypothetical protein